MSLLDRDDFCKLVSRGLKPLEAKKLQRWCDAVCARAENMLTSSLNTPSGTGLPSSEALNVLTIPAFSDTMVECMSDNDSERDGPERTTTMSQRMTWRSWVNSQVLWAGTASGGKGTAKNCCFTDVCPQNGPELSVHPSRSGGQPVHLSPLPCPGSKRSTRR